MAYVTKDGTPLLEAVRFPMLEVIGRQPAWRRSACTRGVDQHARHGAGPTHAGRSRVCANGLLGCDGTSGTARYEQNRRVQPCQIKSGPLKSSLPHPKCTLTIPIDALTHKERCIVLNEVLTDALREWEEARGPWCIAPGDATNDQGRTVQ
jgi:hypothetical protein